MVTWASLVAQTVKNLPAMQETPVQSLGQEDPWRREWLPIQVFLPGEFYRQTEDDHMSKCDSSGGGWSLTWLFMAIPWEIYDS